MRLENIFLHNIGINLEMASRTQDDTRRARRRRGDREHSGLHADEDIAPPGIRGCHFGHESINDTNDLLNQLDALPARLAPINAAGCSSAGLSTAGRLSPQIAFMLCQSCGVSPISSMVSVSIAWGLAPPCPPRRGRRPSRPGPRPRAHELLMT